MHNSQLNDLEPNPTRSACSAKSQHLSTNFCTKSTLYISTKHSKFTTLELTTVYQCRHIFRKKACR